MTPHHVTFFVSKSYHDVQIDILFGDLVSLARQNNLNQRIDKLRQAQTKPIPITSCPLYMSSINLSKSHRNPLDKSSAHENQIKATATAQDAASTRIMTSNSSAGEKPVVTPQSLGCRWCRGSQPKASHIGAGSAARSECPLGQSSWSPTATATKTLRARSR